MRTPAATVAFLLLGIGSASASPILTFPGTPAGMTFTVESVVPVADLYVTDTTSDTYRITLQLVTSGYVGAGHYLNSLAIDVDGTDVGALDAASLITSPGSTTWTLAPLNLGVNSSGPCGSPSVFGSACIDETADATNNLLLTTNGTYTWVFDIDLASTGFGSSTALQFGISTLDVKKGPTYSWKKVNTYGLTANVTLAPLVVPQPNPNPVPVPEPASLLLVGAGLAEFARRRLRSRPS